MSHLSVAISLDEVQALLVFGELDEKTADTIKAFPAQMVHPPLASLQLLAYEESHKASILKFLITIIIRLYSATPNNHPILNLLPKNLFSGVN